MWRAFCLFRWRLAGESDGDGWPLGGFFWNFFWVFLGCFLAVFWEFYWLLPFGRNVLSEVLGVLRFIVCWDYCLTETVWNLV